MGSSDTTNHTGSTDLEQKMAHREEWVAKLDLIRIDIEQGLKNVVSKATIRTRVKSLESLVAKMRNRTAGVQETDLLGMRIIVPFIEDTEQVVSYLRNTQQVIELDRKASSLSSREFGYSAIHLLIRPEGMETFHFPEGCSPVVEVQVRTTLQDAWAEVEHELVYKNTTLPSESMRKKMAALNATLSLSDTIFQEIRDQQKELAAKGHQRFGMTPEEATLSQEDLPHSAEQAKKKSVGLEGVLRKALSAHNRREYEEAVESYGQALELAKESRLRAVLFNHRGLAFSMLGRNHEALRDYGSSLQLDPTYARALINRALLLRRLGYLEEAVKDLIASLELSGIDKSENLFILAQTYRELNRVDLAKQRLNEALALRPDYPEAKKLLSEL